MGLEPLQASTLQFINPYMPNVQKYGALKFQVGLHNVNIKYKFL